MDVFLTENASFPDNWTQMTNPCDEEGLKVVIPQGEAQVQVFAANFLSEKRELYRCGALNTFWSYLIAGAFGRIGRRILGTFYIADSNCTGCAICAKSCPAQTIVMKNKLPRWKTDCEDCNRCFNICPEKAIQVSLPLMVIQIILNLALTVLFIKGVLDYASLIIIGTPWWKVLVDIPLVDKDSFRTPIFYKEFHQIVPQVFGTRVQTLEGISSLRIKQTSNGKCS